MTRPVWQLHAAPDYDLVMARECAALGHRIRSDPAFRRDFLHDPRTCHRDLFKRFAPISFPEYAGTYRGTPGTTLEHRPIHATSITDGSRHFAFTPPEHVPARAAQLLATVEREREEARRADRYVQLLYLTHLFAWFGAIHPFLDGNGHVQRALFAAAAAELDIPLSSRFAIHPRSYDRLLASQLELFTRGGGTTSQLAAIAEYLAFWLSGPFDRPGSGIPTL
jgi:fido (protein-threonine AMPylation protein)